MRTRTLHIDRCSWTVQVFCSVHGRDADEVAQALEGIGCPYGILREAVSLLLSDEDDCGLTYSNRAMRRTVMVVGRASSPAEFLNSITHESRHLEAHIAQTLGLDPWGEDICYVAGDIAAALYDIAGPFLCPECQNRQSTSSEFT